MSNMRFPIGAKVRLVHTGDEAVVSSYLDGGMINVRLVGEDMEIPVFIDDIVAAAFYTAPKTTTPIAPAKPTSSGPPPLNNERQYAILKSMGIQLAFEPLLREDGTIKRFDIYLINDTRLDVAYSFTLYVADHPSLESNAKLGALSYVKLGDMSFDDLNDHPYVHMDCWRISTEGLGTKMTRELRLKPKNFFAKQITAPLLDRPVFHFRLIEKLDYDGETETEKSAEPSGDLKAYTQQNLKPKVTFSEQERPIEVHEVRALAEFSPELDLHIEKLSANFKKLSNGEMLNLQLRRFEEYLDQAVKLGVDRVFIIHGLGEGKLKNAIATRLIQHPYVQTFKNEYHHRYGYGATEVIFL
jgi:Smr domain